jgi:ABC-type phosphate/phosphonate transport system permease subunit
MGIEPADDTPLEGIELAGTRHPRAARIARLPQLNPNFANFSPR